MRQIAILVLLLALTACGGGGSSSTPGSNNPPVTTTPTADAGVNKAVLSGDTVTLDGGASTSAGATSLSYNWMIISKPVGSNAILTNQSNVIASFSPDVAGNYVIGLIVSNGVANSSVASITVTASPSATLAQKSVKIACGADHSLIISAGGTVKALGRNNLGQLGDGSTINRGTPVQVSGLSGVVALTGGEDHSLALKSDGSVWGWGGNSDGQLGDGSTTDRSTPVQVVGLSNVVAIAANWHHSVALKSDGTVWLWGRDYGTYPVKMGGLTNVRAIATGSYFVLALKSDGTVWAWGDNGSGQLGNGTYSSSTLPVKVDSLTNVTQIAASSSASYAIKSDGTVWSWGYWELVGILPSVYGGGNPAVPYQVTGLTGIQAISSSKYHVFALGSGGAIGSLWSWGQANNYGQLGDGTFLVDRRTPVVVSGIGDVSEVAAGRDHSLARKRDGTIWAWGRADYGQIGSSTNMTNYPNLSKLPFQIANLP